MKPMMPIVNTATMICASVSLLPFWNMSQTNFPRPGFCASISAAMSTIQPTPSDRRSPVKISGSADGNHDFGNFFPPAQLENARDIQVIVVNLRHAERRVDERRPQRTQRHGERRADKRFFKHRVFRIVKRADHDHHDGQPRERRHRLEQLDERVHRVD